MDKIVTVLVGIITVAIIAVLVAPRSQTAQVIKSFGDFFTGALSAITRPVS